jgi:hypothetical protein
MKEKLLKLIGLELKSLSTLEFHEPYSWEGPPAAENKYCTKSYTGLKKEREWGTYKMIRFTLKFPDGKPHIEVGTRCDDIQTETLIKRRWFKASVFELTLQRKTTAFIRCGHVEVELTEAECDTLFKDVTEAYSALLLYKKEKREADTLKKIEARIAKHESN